MVHESEDDNARLAAASTIGNLMEVAQEAAQGLVRVAQADPHGLRPQG